MTDFELSILKYCIQEPTFFLKISQHLKTNEKKSYFDKEIYQKIFNFLCWYTDKYIKMPTKETMLHAILPRIKDENIKDNFYISITKMFEEELKLDKEYLEHETIKFIQKALSNELLLSCAIEIENQEYDNLIQGFFDIRNINFDKELGTSIYDTDKIYELFTKVNEDASIPSEYQKLDNIINGGFRDKELYCIVAISAGGKSLFLGNFAINFFFSGKKILFYTLEISEEQLWIRFFSNVLLENKTNLLQNEREELYRKIEEVRTNGNLRVKEYNAHEISSNDIMAHLDELKKVKDFVPDIIIVDYMLLMKTNDKNISNDNSYFYHKRVSEELRNIAKTHEVPVITASQLNRNAMGESGGSIGNISAKDLAESKGILDTVDFMGGLITTPSDKKNNIIKLKVLKNRNGPDNMVISYDVDWDHMKMIEKKM